MLTGLPGSRMSNTQIGFMPVEGLGIHRIWWVGDRYAYASALLDGFSDYIFIVIDLADPTRPCIVGRWWLPGMWVAGGERAIASGRTGLHHAVVAGDVAYGCWRDGGLTLLDVSDKTAPQLIAHRNWSPPFDGGTHSALPLTDRGLLVVADEAVRPYGTQQHKPIWVFDIREPGNPVSIATFPLPSDLDYAAIGGNFGPHNLHENRPGSFQSSTTVFATYQSAGLRAYDLSDPFRPREAGWFVPPTPARWMEPLRGRPKVMHSSDLFVDAQGLCYLTDYDAPLHCPMAWRLSPRHQAPGPRAGVIHFVNTLLQARQQLGLLGAEFVGRQHTGAVQIGQLLQGGQQINRRALRREAG